jgi:hypothetical protein
MSIWTEDQTRVPPLIFERRGSVRPWKIATVVLAVMLAVMVALIAAALAEQGGSTPSSSAAAPSSGAPSASAGGSTPTSSTARGAAAKVDALLGLSATIHQSVVTAIGQVGTCADPASAATTLSDDADQRQNLDDQLGSVDWTPLPGGAQLRSELDAALRSSATSDRDYATWGRHVAATACTAGQSATQDAAYAAAQTSDSIASAAKASFVDSWNPVAESYGLSPRQAANF